MVVMKNSQLRMPMRLQHVAAMQVYVVSSYIRCQKQFQHTQHQGCGKESPFFLYLSREVVAEVMCLGDRIGRHEKIRDISNFTRCRSVLGTWNTRKGNEGEANTSLLKRGKATPMCGVPRGQKVSSLTSEPYQTWSKLRKCNTCRLDCSYYTSRV